MTIAGQLALGLGLAALAATFSGCAGMRAREIESNRRGLLEVFRTAEGRSPSSLRTGPGDTTDRVRDRVPLRFRVGWPLAEMQVTSPYGERSRDFHEGVDLRADKGTPVFSAQTGQVIYAGSKIRGYGRMIVIKDQAGISTVYAHNSKLLVQKGARVRQGQKIALSGNSGRSTGPHLHFEVRQGVQHLDPMAYLSDKRPQLPGKKLSGKASAKAPAKAPSRRISSARNSVR